jgi:hypothetical protein
MQMMAHELREGLRWVQAYATIYAGVHLIVLRGTGVNKVVRSDVLGRVLARLAAQSNDM